MNTIEEEPELLSYEKVVEEERTQNRQNTPLTRKEKMKLLALKALP